LADNLQKNGEFYLHQVGGAKKGLDGPVHQYFFEDVNIVKKKFHQLNFLGIMKSVLSNIFRT